MHSPHDLLSTAEAATLVGKNRSTITRWVESGRLAPAVRTPSGFLLFRRSDLEPFTVEQAS